MRTLPLLLWLVSSLWAGIASADLKLEGATDSLELVTSAAGSIDYTVSWSNVTATALTTPGTSKGNISTATTTTLVAAPSASNWRYIRTATIYNASTTVANAAGVVSIPAPGIRVYPGSCIMAISVGSASASTLAGSYTIMER